MRRLCSSRVEQQVGMSNTQITYSQCLPLLDGLAARAHLMICLDDATSFLATKRTRIHRILYYFNLAAKH